MKKRTIRRLWVVVVSLLISIPALSQSTVITGKITSKDDRQGIVGASVLVKGTNVIAISDDNGSYRIAASKGQVLEFTFLGYVTQEQTVDNSNTINVELEPDATQLSEIVVVGYGTQKKENLTGAVSSVDVKKTLDSRPISDIGRALQGTTAGLSVSSITGEIGTSPKIKIRGVVGSSNGTSDPLILVDNVVVPDLSYVNPDDVQNISILKDAASTAIYGARAAFGVVLITTKSKKSNEKTSINYSNNFAWRTPTAKAEQLPAWQQGEINLLALNHYGFAPATEYNMLGTIYISNESIQKMKEWEQLYGGQSLGSEMVDGRDFEFKNNKQYYYRPWDWYSMFYKDWMPQQTHNLSINGGNGKINYNVALGYLNQEGMTKVNPDTYERYNASASINAQAYKWLSIRANTMLTKTVRETPFIYNSSATIYDYMYYLWRWQPTYPYGTYNGQPYRSAITELNQANMNNTTNNYNNFGIGTTITIIKGLTIDADFTYTSAFGMEKKSGGKLYGLDFWNVKNTTELNNSYKNYADSKLDYVQQIDSRSETFTTNAYATYTKQIKEHSFKVMAGTNLESSENSSMLAKGMSMFDDSKPELNLTYGTPLVGGSHKEWSVTGFFGRINYSFKDRYLLELNGRYDGSSSFPEDKHWGFFPSMSLGYRITEEPFMQPLKPYLSSLKLRASYGSVGNQDVGYDRFRSTLTMQNTYNWLIGGVKTVYPSTPTAVTPYLTWETVTTMDFGFDARFWKDKVGLTFDWYKRTTSNILSAGVTLPNTFGANAPLQNYGEMETPGWEITMDFNHTFGNGLRVGFSGQLTDFKTKVTKWSNGAKNLPAYDQWTSTTYYYEGMVLGDIWGYKVDRLFQESDFTWNPATSSWVLNPDIANQIALESGSFHFGPGDVKYKDLDASGQVNKGDNTVDKPGDKTIIGNTLPRYQYGFRFNAAWKNFDFDIFFQGVGKRSLWVGGNMAIPGYTSGEPWFKGQEDYWRPDNTNAFYPAPTAYGQVMRWNYEINDRYMLNMAYLRCKSLTLGYTLPQKFTQKIYINRLRVYFTAENLFEFDHLGDIAIDPETGITSGVNSTGVIAADSRSYGRSYPYQRTLSFGIQIGF